MEKRFPSTYCKVYLPFLHICIYISEIPITSETVMIHLSDDLLILCSRWTLAAWNLGCHCFRHFHCHVTRIVIIKQRDGKHSKRKSQTTTQLLQGDFSVSSALTPPNMQIQSCRHCCHQLMLLIPECHEQNHSITFPSEKIDSAQSSETPELLEVLNAPKKLQNGTLCWVDLGSHPPCKQQNCPSLFH